MDWFKFTNPNSITKMEEGDFIDNTHISSKTWVERYADAGEFQLVTGVDSGLREFLPVGSYISHIDTDDIMVVEHHEIPEEADQKPELTISGRSFETILEQRVVGANHEFPTTTALSPFRLARGRTWAQAVELIKFHISGSRVVNPRDAIPYVDVVATAYGSGAQEQRVVERGELYSLLLPLLAIDNLGIKTVRPSGTDPNTKLVIHRGVNRAADVTFSADTGDLQSSDYLWSILMDKNCALVSGRWLDILVDPKGFSGAHRRMLYVDGTDIDNSQEHFPTGLALDWIKAAMIARGNQALAKQKMIALQKVNAFKESQGAIFREDYNIGDIVTVSGSYDEEKPMRVAEFVRIEDKEGASAFPTFVDL